MRVRILEEQHNRVVWELRSPLVRILLGFVGGAGAAAGVLALSSHPWRWFLIAAVMLLALGAALFSALTTPLWERGMVERTPEGGAVQREQRWLLRRQPLLWGVPLEYVTGVRTVYQAIEETEGALITWARLCALVREAESLVPLTGWADPASVEALAVAFVKAARLPQESA